MKRKALCGIVAVVAMLIAPASELHAQGGCYFVNYECEYDSGSPCGNCQMGYAVYECGGVLTFKPYGCCTGSQFC